MKTIKTILLLTLATFVFSFINVGSLEAAKRVRGYVTKKGTYVQSHMRSSSNRTKIDNYTTRGNINPYTGKKGYKKLY